MRFLTNYIIISVFFLALISCSQSVRFSKDHTRTETKEYKGENTATPLISGNADERQDKKEQLIYHGIASYYGDKFEGRATASGEIYEYNKLTAAHRTLKFGTKLRVTNLANSNSVYVIVNDRGPFVEGRIIDVSKAAAIMLDMLDKGLAEVEIEIIE